MRDTQATALAIRMEYADLEDFWSPNLGGQGPVADYLATLDACLLSQLREAVRHAYLDSEPDAPRSLAATISAVRGFAPA